MKARFVVMVILFHLCGAGTTMAQTSLPKVTVSSLLTQDFAVTGAMSVPSGGMGLLLRKAKKLYFCYVTETPKSAALTTDYCKPVE